jgi:serine/threonine-protein kinase
MPADPPAKGTRRSLRIGPYAVEAPLSLGTLGSVYRATDTREGGTVALKVLPPELAGNPAARKRFRREAKKAARVRSANVLRVLDFGEASGTWYLATELAEGENLAEYVRHNGALDGEAARDVLVQAARALALLQREGLVPRDLSPENFRAARGPGAHGRITVKLLDIGLLRPPDDDGPGDMRAALAALGVTMGLVLGARPGAKLELGSLAGDVSDDLRGVLRRLLAQRPEERYQTPAALLEALGAEESEGDDEPAPAADVVADAADNPLAALAAAEDDEPPPRKRPVTAKKPKKPVRRRGEEEEPEDEPPPDADDEDKPARRPAPAAAGSRKALVWGAIAFGAVLLVGAVVIVIVSQSDDEPQNADAGGGSKKVVVGPPPKAGGGDSAKEKPADTKKGPEGDKPQEKPPPPLPRLYEPRLTIAPDAARKEYEGPWSAPPAAPDDAPVFRVARVPPAGARPGTAFDSIAAACAAVPEGKWGVIEVEDNGPLFEGPIALAGRNVVIRGGRGYSPLIVWDLGVTRAELKPGKPGPAPARDDVPAFLTADRGTLVLANVSLAVDWPERVAGTGCLVRVGVGGDFVARESTFTVAGKPHAAFTGVRFEGGPGRRCGLSQCYARGARLTALDVTAPGADVLIDRSLLVGGEPPVLTAAAGRAPDATTTLRVVRSTLVGREALLQVRANPEAPAEPALHWLGWDALLWRAAAGAGGTLAELPPGATAKRMTWRALNTLYAGWQTLLSGREPVAGSDRDGWLAGWQRTEGDVSLPQAWATALPVDPAESAPAVYRTDAAPGAPAPNRVGFAATSGPGPLGCDLSQLPWARERWLDLATQRAQPLGVEPLAPDKVTAIPEANDQLFHGARLDLDKTDLGAYLRGVQATQKLAPLVVLHLYGTGRRKTSPVRVEKASLFVYVEPPAPGAEPLVLEPDPTATPPDTNALFEVTGGNLSMLGADVRCPDFKTALLPHYLVLVREGDLFLTATRLQGPLAQPPPGYVALVGIEGSGNGARRVAMRSASISRCTLLSGRVVLQLGGAGLLVNLRDSLLVGTDRAVEFQLARLQKEVPQTATREGSPAERQGLFGEAHLNVEFAADHCTFAARQAALFVEDVPTRLDAKPHLWPVVAEPILALAKDCAFLNPFADKAGKAAPAALLHYSGAAVPRGTLRWQGEGNVYDKRLRVYAAVAPDKDDKPAEPDRPRGYAAWERLWGPAEARPILDWPLKATLDLEKLPLEHLALPAHAGIREKPGADVARLLAPRKAK